MREIMDCLSADSPVQDVCLMKGAQIGGSETGNNWIGYIIDQEPGPAMIVEPSVDMAKRYSRQRIAPMIEDAANLKSKVKDSRSRDSGNTLLCKEFPGGILVLTGANSAAGLRSMPARYLFLDEVDAYPEDVEGEGDPVDLAVARARSFGNTRKVFKPSTPTIKGASRIEVDYDASDKRKYFVPCPECGHMHVLLWANFVIPVDEKTGKKSAKDAYMVCPECGSIIREHQKTYMLEHGEWRATAPENVDQKRRGYHLSTLYSPVGIFSWAECAEEWIKAQKKQSRLKTFVNTILGETWEELGEGTDAETLIARRERYNCDVPEQVLVLTCSVDTQDNRLEYEVKGWGLNREKWGIQYGVIMGDPGRAETWADLDGVLQRKFIREDGLRMKIATTCIDSGGHHTKEVYAYCKKREIWRVWAIKGKGGSGIPFIFRPKRKNEAGIWLFLVGVDVGKDSIASDLMISEPGPNYCHYPIEEAKGYSRNYFEGLTSERRNVRYNKGRASVVWEKRYEGARNEPLDLENYNLAAIEILNPNLELLSEMQGNGRQTKAKQNNPIKKRRVLSSGVSV